MIISSFGFQRKVDFSLYFFDDIVFVFEETHFSILSCLGFNFKGVLFPHEFWDSALFLFCFWCPYFVLFCLI